MSAAFDTHPDNVVRTLAAGVRPVKAMRALWRFLLDKEDTASVIRVFRAADGARPERNFERFCATELGRRILAERRSLARVLCDRDRLRTLPDGSLGRAYLAFVEREGISVEGLTSASDAAMAGRRRLERARVQFRDRLRDMHDLWHVVTGYGRDAPGEICLLAFAFAQTGQRGFGLVAAAWALKEQVLAWRMPVLACAIEGAELGARARWLPAEDWEAMLAAPLDDVRAALGVGVPRMYVRHFGRGRV
jgi:ubiquinone biosynthesis protein COQ4